MLRPNLKPTYICVFFYYLLTVIHFIVLVLQGSCKRGRETPS